MSHQKRIRTAKVAKNAANWLLKNEDIAVPIAKKTALSKIMAIYAEIITPWSIPGDVSLFRTIGYTRVIAMVVSMNKKEPSHFPTTNSPSLIGVVRRSSRVPIRCSSANNLIVKAGVANKNTVASGPITISIPGAELL